MSRFSFPTDRQAEMFCWSIVQTMVQFFHISESEAVGRVNRHFQGQAFKGDNDMIYHETEEFWARTIYYEEGCYWWIEGCELYPKPFP